MTGSLNAAASAPPSELFGEYGTSRTGRLVWLIVGVVMSLAVLALPVVGVAISIAAGGLLDPVTGILLLSLVPGALPLVAVHRARHKLRSGPTLRLGPDGLDFVTMDVTLLRAPTREVVPWSRVRSIEPLGRGAVVICHQGGFPSRTERRMLRGTGAPEGRIVVLGGMGDTGVELAEQLVEWSEERQRREIREGRATESLEAPGEHHG